VKRLVLVVLVAVPSGFGVALAAGGGGSAHADLLPCGILSPCASTTSTTPTLPLLPCGILTPCPPPTTTTSPTTTTVPITTPAPTPVLAYPGAEYDGHRGNQGYASLLVARTVKSLSSALFVFKRGRCSDGGLYANGVSLTVKRGASIDAHGAVTYQQTASGSATTKLGIQVAGREQMTISARFAGGRATGTFIDRFSSRKLNCASEPLPFIAYLDGTPGAPVHNAWATTGRYVGVATDRRVAGKRKPSKRRFTLQVFLPWGVVTQVKFQWNLVCGTHSLRESSTFGFLPIAGGSRFQLVGHGVDALSGGVRGRWKYLLSGRFARAGRHTYNVKGRFSYRVDYTQGKQRLSSCAQTAEFVGKGPRD
jgi:hypothetical protein